MNNFVNTLLSVALGWIRALINNLWSVLNSEDGGAFFRFLGANWLIIVVCLCVAGMLLDAVIYFFRWRPDYVWATHLRRLRRRKSSDFQQAPAAESLPEQEPAAHAHFAQTYAPAAQPDDTWQEPAAQEEAYFDVLWESEEDLDLDWSSGEEEASFGAPQPEPLAYFRDVQAGFAPAVPPEQLYAPRTPAQEPVWPAVENTSVHPGLDEETFRQNLGLDETPAPGVTVVHSPAFQPFTVTHGAEETAPASALQRFAQKARDFMGMDDGEGKTIRDLQSNVDVSKAFHKPVYPQSFDHTEE